MKTVLGTIIFAKKPDHEIPAAHYFIGLRNNRC